MEYESWLAVVKVNSVNKSQRWVIKKIGKILSIEKWLIILHTINDAHAKEKEPHPLAWE